MDKMGENRCPNFYQNIDDNYCFNMKWDNISDSRQWCYVSAKCTNLNGGQNLPMKGASWKVCKDDERTQAKSIDDFMALCDKYGIMGWDFLAKFTLPLYDYIMLIDGNMSAVHSENRYRNPSFIEMEEPYGCEGTRNEILKKLYGKETEDFVKDQVREE